jgi:Protein of unknown function (DUF2867)
MIDMAIGVPDKVRAFFDLRVPNSEFEKRPWRIHELLDDKFRVEDVWRLPTPGGPDDLATLAYYTASSENAVLKANAVVNFLFSARWKLGKLLGWDSERQQVGKRVESLRDHLPPDLLAGERGPDMQLVPFKSVFLTKNEWTSEFSAAMGHLVMHHGWVQDDDGTYYSQMTSLVKPYGRFGPAYMTAIKPFRYLIVYPLQAMIIRRVWPEVRREWSQPRNHGEST